MKKALLFVFTLLFTTLLFFSCKKGDTGPMGPQGPAGTANVMYSSWSALSMTFSTQDSAYEQTIKADSLTQAVLDSGVVLSYLKINNPSTGNTMVVNADKYLQEVYSVGNIDLFSPIDFTGISYRYILLHGGMKAGRLASGAAQGYTKEQLKAMSYDEVMKLLGRNN